MSAKLKIREEAKKLNPIDDIMFRKIAENKDFCQEILGVILDAKCTLGDGREVNIEVQKADDDNHQRRVRYNGAILTTNITDPGISFENVPTVCVIFISKFDVFGDGFPLYHIDRIVRETGKKTDNGFDEV